MTLETLKYSTDQYHRPTSRGLGASLFAVFDWLTPSILFGGMRSSRDKLAKDIRRATQEIEAIMSIGDD